MLTWSEQGPAPDANQARSRRGYSLIEVVMASAVLSMLLATAMGAYNLGATTSAQMINASYQESRLRTALERLEEDLAESRIDYVSIFNFLDGNTANTGQGMKSPAYTGAGDPVRRWERLFPQWRSFFASGPYPLGVPNQSAVCFPTARDPNGRFVIVAGQPAWQGVVVWAAHDFRGSAGIQLVRYVDYGPHAFGTDGTGAPAVRISAITTYDAEASPRILLTDGTVFARDGTGGAGGAVRGRPLCPNFLKFTCRTGNQVHVELDGLSIFPEVDARATYPTRRVTAAHAETDVFCRN